MQRLLLPYILFLTLLGAIGAFPVYAAKTMSFHYADLPNLSGKTFIITGATAGLGKSQAYHLAQHNAHVIVAGRSQEKVQDVVQWIKTETCNSNVEGMIADLMDLQSVISFCDEFLSREIPLYSLTLNAAAMSDKIRLSKNGIEAQWQTNVLAQYCLCMRLLPALKKSPEARIVIVASKVHSAPKSRFPLTNDYINRDKKYSQMKRYGETKCANVLFARYLSDHLLEIGYDNIFVNCLHPGIVATDILRYFLWAPFRCLGKMFLTAPDEGAKTQIYLASSPDVATKNYRGKYFIPNAKLSTASALAMDDVFGRELVSFLESQLKSVLNCDHTLGSNPNPISSV